MQFALMSYHSPEEFDFEIPKSSPIPASQSIAEAWRSRVSKALERQFAAFAPRTLQFEQNLP